MSSKKNNTRANILKATWNLLETQQSHAIRMSDIAKRAGISRQALYLHFKTRTDILIATTLYVDEVNGMEKRLKGSRFAKTGLERLEAFIDAWGNYIPEIYNVSKALLAMQDSDEAAAKAWGGRMQALRDGCQAAMEAVNEDGRLSPDFTLKQATDTMWMLLSVRNWELLTQECGWSQEEYMKNIIQSARALLVK